MALGEKSANALRPAVGQCNAVRGEEVVCGGVTDPTGNGYEVVDIIKITSRF